MRREGGFRDGKRAHRASPKHKHTDPSANHVNDTGRTTIVTKEILERTAGGQGLRGSHTS